MDVKDTFFCKRTTLNCGGRVLDISQPLVMGILNITPDSFYSGSRYNNISEIINTCGHMLEQGAAIVDVGGYSTRPNAEDISVDTEKERVLPIIETITKAFPGIIISVDTFRSEVAEAAINAGAGIINDISGGTLDDKMFTTVAKLQVPYILMHIQGTPQTMQKNPEYVNVVNDVMQYFIEKTGQLQALGVKDIIIDPGFGFGKTIDHNYTLLKNLRGFNILGYPILAGLSRKSMIYKPLGILPTEALNGTTILNTIALQQGINILRVHDVKEAMEVCKLSQRLN